MPLQTQFRPFEVWTPLGTFDHLHACPDRPWGPLSLLDSAYRLSFLGYCDRGVMLITHPHPAPRLRICRATPLLLLCARTACYERTFAFVDGIVVDLFARILIFVWLTYIPSVFFGGGGSFSFVRSAAHSRFSYFELLQIMPPVLFRFRMKLQILIFC